IVISRFLKRYLKAKRTRAPAYSRTLRRIKGGFQGGQEKLRSDFQNRLPGGDRVAVKVGVVQMKKVNDQMGATGAALNECYGQRARLTVLAQGTVLASSIL